MVILSLLLLAAAPAAAPPQRHFRKPVIVTVASRRTRRGAKARAPIGIPARLSVNECADRTLPGCAVKKQSRYRLSTDIAAIGPSAKDRAVKMDGSDCEVIGPKVCPSNPRPVLRAEYVPVGAK
ncbi:hypothetical protein [Sphingomonas alpina]|uniref:Uncharacterized protein n=1 Tax=Sphingomonas alpina TaxID=653931 RepID=A0A7H0LEM3_9SPHN|nr:hypothetical protein [Sphingomonas alpina]QNQ08126.1 hypothetical protein H3Z74_15275 [Sphingomonas alpina]